jgi:putative transposase
MVARMSKEDGMYHHVGRMTPAQGVHLTSHQPVIVWLTVCTKDRVGWLTQSEVMETLHEIWATRATAWVMGDYLLMPDHVHGFCSPHQPGIEIESWVAFWKSQLTRARSNQDRRWQRGVFHHRLRSLEEFREKSIYMLENPLRKGYVERCEDWPWRGRVHDVRW